MGAWAFVPWAWVAVSVVPVVVGRVVSRGSGGCESGETCEVLERVTALIAFIGSFIPLLSEGTGSAIQEDTVVFMVVVQGAALVGALLLWSHPVKAWIAEPAN